LQKRKRILIIILVIFLIGSFAIFKLTGYIPLIGKMIAENKVNDYIKSTYGNTENVDLQFDLYNFGGYKSEDYIYDINNKILFDANMVEADMGKNEKACQKVFSMLNPNMTFGSYHIVEYIDGSDFSKQYHRISIHSLYNLEEISEDNSFIRPAEIIMDFIDEMGSDYNFTGIYLNYYDKNGYYKVSVPYVDKKTITYDMLIENTEKVANDKLPLDYIEWRDEQAK
jgi:hypothetical protein